MPERISQEIFVAMAKALDFIDPERLSMTVVLTAMNRFINESDGSQTAFLDGNQPDRLCAPMVQHIEQRGGAVRLGAALEEIVPNADASVRERSSRPTSMYRRCLWTCSSAFCRGRGPRCHSSSSWTSLRASR